MTDLSKASHRRAAITDKHVGTRLRAARLAKGLSQTQMGEFLGIGFQQVQKYEKGANRISAGKLAIIADAMGLPVQWFFAGIDTAGSGRDLAGELLAAPRGADLASAFMAIDDPHFRGVVVEVAQLFARRKRERLEAAE
jgi:transcriptional regulator with XRE-family HTH domain